MFSDNSDIRAPKSIARTIAFGMVSAALLAACSPGVDDARPAVGPSAPAPLAADPAAPATPGPGDDSAPVPAGGTTGGDGSEIQLDVLTESDLVGAALSGELGCSFSQDGSRPLLVAMGVVGVDEPAQGVVKVAGYVEPLRAPGGFNGMLGNPAFTGQGKTITIEETGPAIGGGESPSRPATLTYQRADGASRNFAGQWQCGP